MKEIPEIVQFLRGLQAFDSLNPAELGTAGKSIEIAYYRQGDELQFQTRITDPEGQDSYPVVTYTWLLPFPRYDDPLKAKAMEIFIEYGLNEGQDVAPLLGYAPLPRAVREQVARAADTISPDYSITLRSSD